MCIDKMTEKKPIDARELARLIKGEIVTEKSSGLDGYAESIILVPYGITRRCETTEYPNGGVWDRHRRSDKAVYSMVCEKTRGI